MMRLINFIDHTNLQSERCSQASIDELCKQAVTAQGKAAAVCVYPQFIRCAQEALAGSGVNIATVSNFPDGEINLSKSLDEIEAIKAYQPDEVDFVFPTRHYLSGEIKKSLDFMQAVSEALSWTSVKLIMETELFPQPAQLFEACQQMLSRAPFAFLKTSTGKHPIGATPESAEILLQAIQQTNPSCGLKVAGGISTIEQALTYYKLTEKYLGTLDASKFRIGSSRLLTTLLQKNQR